MAKHWITNLTSGLAFAAAVAMLARGFAPSVVAGLLAGSVTAVDYREAA